MGYPCESGCYADKDYMGYPWESECYADKDYMGYLWESGCLLKWKLGHLNRMKAP